VTACRSLHKPQEAIDGFAVIRSAALSLKPFLSSIFLHTGSQTVYGLDRPGGLPVRVPCACFPELAGLVEYFPKWHRTSVRLCDLERVLPTCDCTRAAVFHCRIVSSERSFSRGSRFFGLAAGRGDGLQQVSSISFCFKSSVFISDPLACRVSRLGLGHCRRSVAFT